MSSSNAATPATDYVTILPRERIDSFSAPQLRSQLDRQISAGANNFIIDLSATPFIDSTGLAILVSLLRHCRQVGGDVKLVWPVSAPVRHILQLMRFDKLFEFVTSSSPLNAAAQNDSRCSAH